MYIKPEEINHLKNNGDTNLFYQINSKILEAKTENLVEYIVALVKNKIEELSNKIKDHKVVCHYKLMKVCSEDSESIEYVKSLQPYSIEWSNIAEYMDHVDFIKLSKAVSA